jgi:hypothetical protein
VTGEIESLVRAVNRTNTSPELESGLTITDAIAQRDALALRRKLVTTVWLTRPPVTTSTATGGVASSAANCDS